ncbi:MAG TPA: hypothetical protein VN153_03185, partial [Tahibacter sp.]|nr:hypothetical protein [Tahibacter sp.]
MRHCALDALIGVLARRLPSSIMAHDAEVQRMIPQVDIRMPLSPHAPASSGIAASAPPQRGVAATD